MSSVQRRGGQSGRRAVFLGVGAASVLGPQVGQAQQATETSAILEEVVVTARKREESLLEIPESVAVIGEREFLAGQFNKMEDIGDLIPNLSLSERGDGKPNVTIRGVGSFGNVQGVGFYLDGVQIFDDQQVRRGDMARIEVLKGPQGTLYGGSNIGGAIKWVTNMPDPDERSGHVTAGLGTNDTLEFEGHLNMPLGESWAVRLFGYGYSDQGFLINPVLERATGSVNRPDPHIDRISEEGLRVSVAGDITDRLFAYAWVRRNDLLGPMNVTQREPDTNFEFPQTRPSSLTHQRDVETTQAAFQLDYDLGRATLTSLTSYAETDQFGISDVDASHELVIEATQPESAETFIQELRLSSNTGGPLEYLGGLYYLDRDFFRNFDLQLYPPFFLLADRPLSPNDPRLPQTPAEEHAFIEVPLEHRDQHMRSFSGFGTVMYRFGDFEVEGGLRLERWEVETTNFASNVSGKQSDTEVLPKASLSYFFDQGDAMAYASFSRGFHPGGFNLSNFAGDSTLFGFDGEESDNFEIGYKGQVTPALLLEAAAFYIDYKNRQFEVQVRDPVTDQFVEGIINIGDSEHLGLELTANWQATDYFSFMLSAGVVDAEWKSGTIVDGSDLSGSEPLNAPDTNFSATAMFDRPVGDDLDFWARVQFSSTGDQTVSLDRQFVNPSYDFVNFGAGLRGERWELAVDVENVFDEEYYTDLSPFPDFDPFSPLGQFLLSTRGQPRWVTARVTVSF